MDSIGRFLFWLDAAPARYWTVGWICLGVTALLAVVAPNRQPGRGRSGWLFAGAVILTLLAFRWPTFYYRFDLNPDEAQIIAGAITLDHDPVVWRAVDTTTHGPLLEYLLVVAHVLGAPYNYFSARVVAVLLQALTLLAVWGTLRSLAPERVARFGILPGLAFWSLIAWEDFVHYSSELPGLALLAFATYATARLLGSDATDRARRRWALLAGASAGLVPFGKLQSAPQAAVLLVVGAACIWFMPSLRTSRKVLLGCLSAGVGLIGLLLTIFLQCFDLWGEFWRTYVLSALDFLGTSAYPFAAMPGRFFNFAATAPLFSFFFWGGLVFAVLYLREPVADARLRAARRVAWLLLGAAFFTVIRPGRESVHYLHLLVAPLTLLVGLTLASATASTRRWRVAAAFGLLALAPQIGDRLATGSRFVGNARLHWDQPPSAAAQFIRARAERGDAMAMWGWQPNLLVEVHMRHATREAQSGNQIMQWPLTPFFVERYVADLAAQKPAWFVDAVGPGAFIFDARATQAHESVPQLRELIDQRYDFLTEIGNLRIYHLKPEAAR